VLAVLVAFALHLNLPAARREIARRASEMATDRVLGTVRIEDLRHVGLRRLELGRATVEDPRGARVLTVDGLVVEYDLLTLARALLTTGATAEISRVRLRGVEATLIDDGDGAPTLTQAFAPRHPTPEVPAPPSQLRLLVRDAALGSLRVGGTLSGRRYSVEGRLAGVRVLVEPAATHVRIDALRVLSAPVAGLTRSGVDLVLQGVVELPTLSSPDRVSIVVRGVSARLHAGNTDATAEGAFDGVHLVGRIRAHSRDALGSLLDAPVPLRGATSASIDVAGTLHRIDWAARVFASDALHARADGWVDLDALSAARHAPDANAPIADAQLELADVHADAFAPAAPPVRATTRLSLHAVADATGTSLAIDGGSLARDPSFGEPSSARSGLRAAAASPSRSALPPLPTDIDDPFRARPKLDDLLRLAVHARAHHGDEGTTASGTLAVLLDGARAGVEFELERRPAGQAAGPSTSPPRPPSAAVSRVAAHLSLQVPALSALRAVRLPLRGALDVDVDAEADLEARTFAVRGSFGARELIAEAGVIPSLAVALRAGGPFATPWFDASLAVPEVRLAPDARGKGEALRDVRARAHGTTTALEVEASLRTSAAQRLELSSSLERSPSSLRVHDLRAKLVRGAFRGEVALRSLALSGSTVSVQGLRLASTAGGLRVDATVDWSRHRYDVDLASTPLDIASLSEALALDLHGARGLVTLQAHTSTLPGPSRYDFSPVAADDRGTPLGDLAEPRIPSARLRRPANDPRLTGRLRVDVTRGWLPVIGELGGHLTIVLDDRLLEGGARVSVKDLVDAKVRFGGAIAGRADDPKALRAAIGHVDLSIADLDLGRVHALLAKRGVAPSMQLAGHVALDGRVTRATPEAPPEVAVTFKTRELAVASGATLVAGIDLHGAASLVRLVGRAGEGARVQLGVELRASDGRGRFATLTIGCAAGWSEVQALVRGDPRIDRRRLLDQPFRVALVVPRRPAQELPAAVRRAIPLDGALSAELHLEGTALAPKLTLDATLADVKDAAGLLHTLGLRTTYDGKRVHGHVEIAPQAAARGTSRPGLLADLEVVADAAAILTSNGADTHAEPPWTAKLDAKLDALPLELFPAFGALNAAGSATGELHVEGLHDPRAAYPVVRAALGVAGLRFGPDRFDETKIDLHVDPRGARATLTMHGPAGSAEVGVDAPLVWERALVPGIAPNAVVTSTVKAKSLRLKPFEALITPLDELDGRLDVDASASVGYGATGASGAPAGLRVTALQGSIHLHDGTLVVDAVGDRWQHVVLDARLGLEKIELEKLHLEGVHGKADATGNVTLASLAPKALHLELKTDKLAFSTGGIPRGDLSGKIVVEGDLRDPKLPKLDVTITPLTLDLAPSSDRKPQELDDEPSIVVRQPIHKPRAPTVKARSAQLRIAVHLPTNVWIRRDDLRIALQGEPVVEVAGDAVTLSGELSAERGWVQALGKRFTIDHAKVKFDGTSELNPTLDLAVNWDAPDASKVTIAISGRLETPKVTLTADPPASQSEIMSLLALGRRDAGSATNQAQADRSAAAETAAVVQGFTGALLGQQLQKILPSEMSISIQGGDQGLGDARIGGGYQLKNVYFEVDYRTSSQQPGSSLTETQPRTTFGVEWRFKPTWALITTFGDTGSAAVDLVWHYRY
jgi:hypothetical protein